MDTAARGMLSAHEAVLVQRREIVHALSCSGSPELIQKTLDILLAKRDLSWEDHQNIVVSGRPLVAIARELLELVYKKGLEACEHFFAALQEVLPGAQATTLPFTGCCSCLKEQTLNPSSQVLLTQRPSLVHKLQGRIDGALEALLESRCFTTSDCDEVRQPKHTPAQEARCLLDYVRSKGELAARVLLQYIEQNTESEQQGRPTPLKEFSKYQRKLSSFVSAQSCFLSTYGGTGHMSLDDTYTEGQLDLSQGSADAQGPLSLEDIMSEVGTVNKEADTVLVSGEAGTGKSTLLQRLHSLWARGAALQEFLLLFPFSCRELNSEQMELSVQELLFQHCCWPDKDQEGIFQFILDKPHLILFTFDGLDELKQSFSDQHRHCCPTQRAPVHVLLFNLIQGSLMKGVRKLVTSRREAVFPLLQKHLRKEVLLKGFSPDGIERFVRKNHSNPTLAAKVLESLQANTALLGLCHRPVLCWIVSQCHKELLGRGEGSPQTITDVYLMILQHFFQRQSSQCSSKKAGWLPEHLHTILHLGQLAFNGIETTNYVFSVAEFKMCGVTEFDLSLGFLLQSKTMSSTHSKQYEFVHVTMQCFFAALYSVLSSADHSAIAKLFGMQDRGCRKTTLKGICFRAHLSFRNQVDNTAMKKTNLQIAATFVSGLLSLRHENLWLQYCSNSAMVRKVKQVTRYLSKGMQHHFKSIPQPVKGEKKSMHAMPDFLWLIKCIYEMQLDKIAEAAMSKLQVEHLKLTYCNIGPVDCTALAYVLQHLRDPVGLDLDNNAVGDVGVEQLLPCMHICNSLYLRNSNITDEGIRQLLAKLIHCENFRKIALFNNKLTDVCTQHFCHLLKTRQDFLALRLGNNNITAEGAKWLAEGLKLNHSLQFLGLWGNKIGDAGAVALASALENSTTLLWLSLVGNEVGNAGACAVANIIRKSPSLENLWLSENYITRTGVECLMEALKHNTHLKLILLKNNNLSLEEEKELSHREPRLEF